METKMESKQKQYVTRDMIIGDVLKQYPDAAVIMLENGLHCVGCHANVYDTIEAGSLGHGMSEEQVDEMVVQINSFIDEQKSKESSSVQEEEFPEKIMVTDAASKKILELLKKDKQEGFGLRISVMPGGCSGFVYQMNFEKDAQSEDKVFEEKGVKIFVDEDSAKMLKGAEVDYVDTLSQSGFKINNPSAKHNCGCGKSFG